MRGFARPVRPGDLRFRGHHSARRILGIRGSPASHTALASFRRRYGYDSTLTTSYLDGLHAFFYGEPNSLPFSSRSSPGSRITPSTPPGISSGSPGDSVCWTMDEGEE